MSLSNSSALRQALRETYRADETQIVNSLIEKARFTPEEQRRIFERARPLVETIRDKRLKTTGIDAFLNTYDLSSREGVVLMCMAEALLLVESGERLYHANLWWGPFICFWVFWLESVSVFLQQTRTGAMPRWRLAVCAAALAWHIVSGVCFLVMLLQGVSYNVPILTYNLW